ncbi:unnamed protein product [Ectocarpus sp. 8 AP-2014]|eukprot:TRINITY_DN4439_c0_g1_i1.p1 TRINITY_DN4439_c0_g1~~TRINITY_DN4439_c0_g1_i1.p1  ORF type:complete len:110 (-),score=39.02 TRINITY_DN4439_c0_g1_i1:417-746(-)
MADTEVADLKGGHAPAQKVGGVRMVSRGTPTKSESDKNDKPAKPSDEDVEEFGEDEEVKRNTKAIVSGAKTGEVDAFPKAAVQSYHEKPHPTHEKNPVQKPTIIQQPRK